MEDSAIFSAQLKHLRQARNQRTRSETNIHSSGLNQNAEHAKVYCPSSRSVPCTPSASPELVARPSYNTSFITALPEQPEGILIDDKTKSYQDDKLFAEPESNEKETETELDDQPLLPPLLLHSVSQPARNRTEQNADPKWGAKYSQTPSPPLQSLPPFNTRPAIPPLSRSLSLYSEPRSGAPSAQFSQKIPLRTISGSSIGLLSPLSSSSSSRNRSPHTPEPSPRNDSQQRQSPSQFSPLTTSIDGLTPNSTLRTLKPLLSHSQSLNTSVDTDAYTCMTPSSATRMLLTGHDLTQANTEAPSTVSRRLSGKLGSFSQSNNQSLNQSANSTISPPLIPKLQRSTTTDQSSPNSHKRNSLSQRDLLDMIPSMPSNILNGEVDSDSDDDDDESGLNLKQAPQSHTSEATEALLNPHREHSAIFTRLIELLPFNCTPSMLRRAESAYAITVTSALCIALFSEPVRLAILPKYLDSVVAVVLTLIMLLLGAEWAFFFSSNPTYRWTLESALDVCAVISLVPQIVATWREDQLSRFESAAMMSLRAGVMVRLVGLLRLLPVRQINRWRRLRCFMRRVCAICLRHATRYVGGNASVYDADVDAVPELEPEDEIVPSVIPSSHASRIGQLLADYTAHRAVLGVFITLLIYNYFHPNQVRTMHPFAIRHLDALANLQPQRASNVTESLFQYYEKRAGPDLVQLVVDGIAVINDTQRLNYLRPSEMEVIRTPHYSAIIDTKRFSQSFAMFDCGCLLLMLVLCPVLLKLIFEDVHAVIFPIERMVKFVANLAKDPLTEIAPLDNSQQSRARRKSLFPPPAYSSYLNSNDQPGSFPLDSLFVELTLQKLAILLQLVFGSAGANIIANNIKGDFLEVQVPGRKMYGIFSFVSLHNFPEIVSALEQSASTLTNDLSEMIHSLCVLFGGEINKNIGSSWLLVWKVEAATAAERGKAKLTRRASLKMDGPNELEVPEAHEPSIAPKSPVPVVSPLNLTDHITSKPVVSPLNIMSELTIPPSIQPRASTALEPDSTLRQRRGALKRSDSLVSNPLSQQESPRRIDPLHRDRESISIDSESAVKSGIYESILRLRDRGSSLFSAKTFFPFQQAADTDTSSEIDSASSDSSAGSAHKSPQSTSSDASHEEPHNKSNASPESFYTRTVPLPSFPHHQHGWRHSSDNCRLAEQAMSAFLLTVVQLATSPAFHRWRQHPDLLKAGLRLKFGIGLHIGWAIEGAIGSAQKIDASYLSPNVNLSSRLSMLCAHYHVPILFSSQLFSLLSLDVQKRCRKIDVVSVKGSSRPIGIYTFDIDYGSEEALAEARWKASEAQPVVPPSASASSPLEAGAAASSHSYDERMRKKQLGEIHDLMHLLQKFNLTSNHHSHHEAALDDSPTNSRRRRASTPVINPHLNAGIKRSTSTSSLATLHSPLLPSLNELLALLQSNVPSSFVQLFNAASACYIDGDWRSAGRLLVRVLAVKPHDGPSQLLLKVMAGHGFRAPTGWKGFRHLNKK